MKSEQTILTDDRSKVTLIRPLLGLRHAELVDYLRSTGCKWREDASNSQPVAIRNRLRNEVFPLLDEISNRDSAAAMVRAQAESTEHLELEKWALERVAVMDPQGRVHVPSFSQIPQSLKRAVMCAYLRKNMVTEINRELLERIINLTHSHATAVVNLPGGGRMRRSAGRLWIDP